MESGGVDQHCQGNPQIQFGDAVCKKGKEGRTRGFEDPMFKVDGGFVQLAGDLLGA